MCGRVRLPTDYSEIKIRPRIAHWTIRTAPHFAQPFEVALALREKGGVPHRIWFDPEAYAWIAKVIDWGKAPAKAGAISRCKSGPGKAVAGRLEASVA